MDPTTLLTAVLLAIGLLGTDAVIYSGSVEIEVAPPPKLESISIDQTTLALEFENRLNAIAQTTSVVRPPDIRSSTEKGLGMALAEAASLQTVAYSLQTKLGFKPDRLRFSLFAEDGKLRGLVSGSSHASDSFRNVLVPNKDEPLPDFVQRCALWGVSQLAPYSTALYLLERHASDEDFTDALSLTDHAEALLPPTPRSFDRGLFENVRGLIALFKNDKKAARTAFDAAMRADPTNPVPFLNAAFTDLELDEHQKAADRMEQLIRIAPPANKVLLATAYMTWGAAMMGKKDYPSAERLLVKAVQVNPQSATARHLLSEAKELQGDKAGAARTEREAMEQTTTLENYAEVAALYFHLSWGDNQTITRSKFSNPAVVTFH